MEAEFKFPTDYYYVLLDGGSRKATYYNNNTIKNANQWYGWKPDRIHIFDKNSGTSEVNRRSEFFVGPFNTILIAKIYVLKRRKLTLLKVIDDRPASRENLRQFDELKIVLADAAEGEIKKVNKLLNNYMDLMPEYFI